MYCNIRQNKLTLELIHIGVIKYKSLFFFLLLQSHILTITNLYNNCVRHVLELHALQFQHQKYTSLYPCFFVHFKTVHSAKKVFRVSQHLKKSQENTTDNHKTILISN